MAQSKKDKKHSSSFMDMLYKVPLSVIFKGDIVYLSLFFEMCLLYKFLYYCAVLDIAKMIFCLLFSIIGLFCVLILMQRLFCDYPFDAYEKEKSKNIRRKYYLFSQVKRFAVIDNYKHKIILIEQTTLDNLNDKQREYLRELNMIYSFSTQIIIPQ